MSAPAVHPGDSVRTSQDPADLLGLLSRLERAEDTWTFGEPWEILRQRCGGHQVADLVFSAGWDDCGHGYSRSVFCHPACDQVLKIGMPHVNRQEAAVSRFLQGRHPPDAAWTTGEHHAAPVTWISSGGSLLLMQRAECTLSDAMNRDEDPVPYSESVHLRHQFQDLGFIDVRNDNVGWFPAERRWKVIDLGETFVHTLSGTPPGPA